MNGYPNISRRSKSSQSFPLLNLEPNFDNNSKMANFVKEPTRQVIPQNAIVMKDNSAIVSQPNSTTMVNSSISHKDDDDLSIIAKTGPNETDESNENSPQSQPLPTLPPQLGHLSLTQRIIIKHKLEFESVLDFIPCIGDEKNFKIFNEENQLIYHARESSECCSRMWCGIFRPMVLNIFGADDAAGGGTPILTFDHPSAGQGICCPCSQQSMCVKLPCGRVIGRIEEKWNISPTLHVLNADGIMEFVIKGPCFQLAYNCAEVDFAVHPSDGDKACGIISKKWRGVLHEYNGSEITFGVELPLGISLESKALLLAATFLVDYVYYEKTRQRNRRP